MRFYMKFDDDEPIEVALSNPFDERVVIVLDINEVDKGDESSVTFADSKGKQFKLYCTNEEYRQSEEEE